jgi:hypothetical protein
VNFLTYELHIDKVVIKPKIKNQCQLKRKKALPETELKCTNFFVKVIEVMRTTTSDCISWEQDLP